MSVWSVSSLHFDTHSWRKLGQRIAIFRIEASVIVWKMFKEILIGDLFGTQDANQ